MNPVCFPAYQTPSEKGFCFKRKELAPKVFPFRVDIFQPFQKGSKSILKKYTLVEIDHHYENTPIQIY